MTACLRTEFVPSGMRSELLVGEPDGLVDLVGIGMDPDALCRRPVISPRGVLFREREVFPGIGPTLADQLSRRALVGSGEYSSELRRLRQHRILGQHESSQLGRYVRAGRSARVVVRVEEPFLAHYPNPFCVASRSAPAKPAWGRPRSAPLMLAFPAPGSARQREPRWQCRR